MLCTHSILGFQPLTNSIVYHVTEKPDGTKKVRLCLDPKDLNRVGADLNKVGADLNKAGPDVNKEIHFITTTSCPINIKSIQEATMQDQDLNKLKDVIFKGWPEYRKQCPQEL